MLNVTAQRSASGAKAYFAKSDYYADGRELVGRWGGKGAVLLGLFGEVDKAAFDALCDNRVPGTGKQLTAMTRDGRRTGYDFTWSAPKSVSVVHALTGDDRIMAAFRDSVRDTMGEMEADMQTRVRKGGKEGDRPTGNLLWAEFVHLTSRPVGGLPCPQLHAHCFTFNATYDVAESRWKAGQFGKIKGDGYYWQAVQQARFAGRLKELGYGIRATKDAFEIGGVPDSAIRAFSLRTKLIDGVAERLGITDPKAKAKLAATTREAKLDGVPYEELVRRWEAHIGPAELGAIRAAESPQRRLECRDADHVTFAADHTFERASVVEERRLLALALRHGVGEVTPGGVRAEAGRLKLLRREEGGKVWVTTPEVLAEEKRMLGFATGGKGSCRPIAADLVGWERELAQSTLSDEQRAAVAQVLTTPDRVTILRGGAGTGKTTLTREAVRWTEAAGKPVVMLAPSARASRGVLRDEGFAEADTLARFMVDWTMQAGARSGVIWVDEAGLVGSRTMAALFDLAKGLDARVVLAGDKRQMGSVERGAALRVLEDVAGLTVAEVTDVRRQAGRYKEAVRHLAKGDAAHGLATLDALGWVKLMPARDPYQPVAKDYVRKVRASNDKERGVLIVSPTHAEADRITAAVRAELRAEGLLGTGERAFARLVPTQWTQAERGDAARYAGGEVLQLHRSSGAFKAGERVTAAAALASPAPPKPAHFAAYAPATIRLAAGDAIRVTANGRTKDGEHRLNNGAAYTVKGFTKAGDIELSNGWVVDQGWGHLGHGYVATAHAAQGRTVDHVLIVQSAMSSPAASREAFYVAASRGRRSATVYTDDRQGLLADAERSRPRPSATELAHKPRAPVLRRVQEAYARTRLAALVASKTLAYRPGPARGEREAGRAR